MPLTSLAANTVSLSQEVLSVRDYYEFETEPGACDKVVEMFWRVWTAINGGEDALIDAINKASKLGAARLCRACVRVGADFGQGVMVEMARKSLGVRVVTEDMCP